MHAVVLSSCTCIRQVQQTVHADTYIQYSYCWYDVRHTSSSCTGCMRQHEDTKCSWYMTGAVAASTSSTRRTSVRLVHAGGMLCR